MTQSDQVEEGGGQNRRSEPLFHAPWPAMVLSVGILALYLAQSVIGLTDEQWQALRFAPADLGEGRWLGLFTSLFMHGSWPHAIFNAGFALAFGAPVARLFGLDLMRSFAFFTFYVLCGVIGNLGFAAAPHEAGAALVGASGAVAGLMGAASRLMGRREGTGLAGFTSSAVVGMAAAWISCNALIGLFGMQILSGGAGIAWQAHLAGYAAGLFLIGPVMALMGRRPA